MLLTPILTAAGGAALARWLTRRQWQRQLPAAQADLLATQRERDAAETRAAGLAETVQTLTRRADLFDKDRTRLNDGLLAEQLRGNDLEGRLQKTAADRDAATEKAAELEARLRELTAERDGYKMRLEHATDGNDAEREAWLKETNAIKGERDEARAAHAVADRDRDHWRQAAETAAAELVRLTARVRETLSPAA